MDSTHDWPILPSHRIYDVDNSHWLEPPGATRKQKLDDEGSESQRHCTCVVRAPPASSRVADIKGPRVCAGLQWREE